MSSVNGEAALDMVSVETISSFEMSLLQGEIARKAGYGDGLNDRWRSHWKLKTGRNTKIEEDLQQLFNQ